ncbi:MMPL family protein [Mycobacterium intracellulare]|nr:MMPL family protein [Mycobacterium intracellulare]
MLFSAVTVALSMSATVAFPMYFLKSFAYAGVATVAFVATASIVITPAAIVLLGDRLDAFNVRRFLRRMLRRPEPAPKPVEQLFWYRSSKFVMRRWAPVGLAVVGLLLLLGLPFFSVKWGFPDDRVLPRSASAHQVGDRLRNDFADDSATSVPVVVPDASGLNPGDFDSYAAALSRVPDVAAVSAPGAPSRAETGWGHRPGRPGWPRAAPF